jgi:hypothetical protein
MSGEWNVDKIARGMTAKQFLEWVMFARMEPFGDVRADLRAASIAQMVFNMAVAGKDRKPLGEFLLKFDADAAPAPEKPKQPWQEKKAIAMVIVEAYAKSRSKTPKVLKTANSEERARAMTDEVMKQFKEL